MTTEKTNEYYRSMEKMMIAMTQFNGNDLDSVKEAIREICRVFSLSGLKVDYFDSVRHELMGKGKVFLKYEAGSQDKEILKKREVSRSASVTTCTLYARNDAPEHDEEELRCIGLLTDMIMTFVTRSEMQNTIERLTFYDDNGYQNLRSFIRYVDQLNAQKKLGEYSAVHFNLRHFSLINQQIGRAMGDVVIQKYIEMLQNAVGVGGLVCRVGGDNFVAIFKDNATENVLTILRGVPVTYDDYGSKRVMVSSSTGVFCIPDDFVMHVPGDLIDVIISASTAAKSGGKDSVVFYDDNMRVDKKRVMVIQQLLPKALREEEFKVFYQPKIDVKTGEIVGAEALCRWLHDGRIIPPMEFIPVLEQTTEICQLGS